MGAARREPGGLSPEEKAALCETLAERRQARHWQKNPAAAQEAVESYIQSLPPADQQLAWKVHTLVQQVAPAFRPRLWYGMPAYTDARERVVCFFQPASKFKTRYATIGFTDAALLDEGNLWPVSYALRAIGPSEEAFLRARLQQAFTPPPVQVAPDDAGSSGG